MINKKTFIRLFKQIPKYAFLSVMLKILSDFISNPVYVIVAGYRRKMLLNESYSIPLSDIKEEIYYRLKFI